MFACKQGAELETLSISPKINRPKNAHNQQFPKTNRIVPDAQIDQNWRRSSSQGNQVDAIKRPNPVKNIDRPWAARANWSKYHNHSADRRPWISEKCGYILLTSPPSRQPKHARLRSNSKTAPISLSLTLIVPFPFYFKARLWNVKAVMNVPRSNLASGPRTTITVFRGDGGDGGGEGWDFKSFKLGLLLCLN